MSAVVLPESRQGFSTGSTGVLQLGYVALLDAAPLLVADELGFFAERGLRVALHLVPNWASVRDRLAFGALHGAQLLSPMAVAGAAGLGGIGAELRVASTLSLNGNAVVLANALWHEIEAEAGPIEQGPLPAAALAAVVAARRARGAAPLRLAVVYPYSSHNYLVRHWLASAGLDPDADVDLVVVPPAGTVAALRDGVIDGFCAGAPWGGIAAAEGVGRVALRSGQVWPQHPEKVLGVTRAVLEAEPAQVAALIAAAMQAATWLGDPDHGDDAARILAQRVLFLPVSALRTALADASMRPHFPTGADSFPHPQHGAAWITLMRRWGHIPRDSPPDPTRLWDSTAWRIAAAAAGCPDPTPPAWSGVTTTNPAQFEDA